SDLDGDDRLRREDRLHKLIEFRQKRPTCLPKEIGGRQQRRRNVERSVSDEFRRCSNVDCKTEQKIEQREHKKAQPCNTKEPEEIARHIADPLADIQAPLEQRILEQEYLDHTLAPAASLTNEATEGLRL